MQSIDGGASRREFIVWSIATASGMIACGRADEQPGTAMTTPLTDLSATEAVAAMRRGDLSAEDYAAALLERCEQAKSLNAFITLEPERVLEAARAADRLLASGAEPGALHGLPIPVKDSVNTKDYRTTGGTRALQDFHPAEDAELVRRLSDAGAIVMGKTNIHELSFGWTSNNLAFGAVHNPYDSSRIPGGSSGGSAAAVAARMAPLGIAEDTQGSIRVPAALCGIVGFRPTQGRYPNQGVVPITPLFDQVGPLARNVADLALFDHVITGEALADAPARLAGIRLGVAREFYFDRLDTEVERVTEAVLDELSDAGVERVEVDVPDLGRLIGLTTNPIQLYHVMPMLIRYLADFGTGVTFDEVIEQASVDIRNTFAKYVLPGGEFVVAEEDFIAARDVHLPALRQTLSDYFDSNHLDAMVFPATQISAPPIGCDTETELNGMIVPFESVISRNISPGSTGGLPGLIIPATLNNEGLPVCLELDGPAGSDHKLLAIGRAVENVLGHLPPPRI
ncbi:MAG: indoleacetamide hydrolase [Myxococcales bacterium]|nr:indoleacetamide hydrolase [Myxococcales bacterium]